MLLLFEMTMASKYPGLRRFGAYDRDIAVGTTDRLVAVSQLSGAAA